MKMSYLKIVIMTQWHPKFLKTASFPERKHFQTAAFIKRMNIDIWVVGTSDQLFVMRSF